MICPRCGSVMEDGICNECGFPVSVIIPGRKCREKNVSHFKRDSFKNCLRLVWVGISE